jgi:uncharacterized protein YjbJ (UPF0337 family)
LIALQEAVGTVTDDESLKGEGQAQQDKADAEREVAAREADAEKARGQAAAAEAEERALSSRSSDRPIVFGGEAEARQYVYLGHRTVVTCSLSASPAAMATTRCLSSTV